MRSVRTRLLVTVSIALATTVLGASAASAIPPPPDLVTMFNISDECEFAVMSSQTVLGQAVEFANNSGSTRTVSDQAGFWSFTVSTKQQPNKTMNHAGTYTWLCDANAGSAAPIGVRMSGPASISKKPFNLTWANSAAYGGYRYSVQYKIGSGGSVATWRSKVSARSATFSPGRSNVTYYFRAMTWLTGTVGSGWSAWKTVHVT